MRILLVFTHPSKKSYCNRLFVTAEAALKEAGHEVRTRDLYRENFDPILTTDEWHDYFDDPEPLVQKQCGTVADLRWAEGLVFVHPTWYFGTPAVLKGWFDRTWLPGVTFEKATKKGQTTKALLKNIRLLCVITTSGSPWWFLKFAGDPQRHFFTRALRPIFGAKCRTKWLQLYNMNVVTQSDRDRFVKKVERTLATIA